MEIVRKITVKGVAGKIDIEKVLAAEGKKMKLAKIYGIAQKAMPDQSDYGSFIKFRGRFRGVNFETGETYEAGAMILPPVAQDMLAGVLEGAEGGVEFAFEVGVRYEAEAVTKYVYEVKPLFEASKDDPLERLANNISLLENKASDKPSEKATPAGETAAAKK